MCSGFRVDSFASANPKPCISRKNVDSEPLDDRTGRRRMIGFYKGFYKG